MGKRNRQINRGLRQDDTQKMDICLVCSISFPSATSTAQPAARRVQAGNTASQHQAAYRLLPAQLRKAVRDTERVARQLDHATPIQTRKHDPALVDNLLYQVENLTALVKRLYPHQEECGGRNKI
nr:MAG TPA: hypothetical protein [Bacteriophage sp.]